MNQFLNQIDDRITRAQQFQYPEFTVFLDLHQLSLYRNTYKTITTDIIALESKVFADDERRMLGFFPKTFLEYMDTNILELFPVCVIQVRMFDTAQILFNHRDLLGALLAQGIDRRLLGDMLFNDSSAFFACHERIHQMLLDDLILIGSHRVTCSLFKDWDYLATLRPKTKATSTTIPSLRLDNVLKAMLNISRADCQQYILRGMVRVNQEEVTKRHFIINEKDIISVRGRGKYKVETIGNASKKGRIWITTLQYI